MSFAMALPLLAISPRNALFTNCALFTSRLFRLVVLMKGLLIFLGPKLLRTGILKRLDSMRASP